MADSLISVTGLSLVAAVGGFVASVQWSAPNGLGCLPYMQPSKFEFYTSTSPSASGRTKAGESTVGVFTLGGLPSPSTRYVWVRAVDGAGNVGSFYPSGNGQAVTTVSTIPPDGSITGDMLADNAVSLRTFTPGITPVEIVTALPQTDNFAGRVVYLNGKLYRHSGSPAGAAGFSAAVEANDISGLLANAQIESLSAAKIAGQITETQISNSAISTPKIAAGAVVTAKLAAGAVVADNIAANAVTAAKIATNAVTADSIVAGAISAAKIASSAITADKLAVNSVTAGAIQSGAILADKIASNAITSDKIATNAITANKINVSNLGAISATLGNVQVNGGLVVNGTLTANKVAGKQFTDQQIVTGGVSSSVMTGKGGPAVGGGTLQSATINIPSGFVSIDFNGLLELPTANPGNFGYLACRLFRNGTQIATWTMYYDDNFGFVISLMYRDTPPAGNNNYTMTATNQTGAGQWTIADSTMRLINFKV